jgi:hypothetical protein
MLPPGSPLNGNTHNQTEATRTSSFKYVITHVKSFSSGFLNADNITIRYYNLTAHRIPHFLLVESPVPTSKFIRFCIPEMTEHDISIISTWLLNCRNKTRNGTFEVEIFLPTCTTCRKKIRNTNGKRPDSRYRPK